MPEQSVTRLLAERHGVQIRPGGKGPCPYCHHETLSVKRDDSLAKCFHADCGRVVTLGEGQGPGISTALSAMMADWHQALLDLQGAAYRSAYHYLIGEAADERRIHPAVVAALGTLGVVPGGGYDVARHFVPLIEAVQQGKADQGLIRRERRGQRGRPSADEIQAARAERIEQLQTWRDGLAGLIAGRAGWLVFGLADSRGSLVSIKLREPFTKHFVRWNAYRRVTGVFGAELFDANGGEYDDHLIVVEGEFNLMAVQSVHAHIALAKGKTPGWIWGCAVGGVEGADLGTVAGLNAKHVVVVYDHDAHGAGATLVDRLRTMMAVEATTTPDVDSDIDSYTKGFGSDHAAAWQALQALFQRRERRGRIWSGTGEEFLRGKRVVPARLGAALLERHSYRFAAGLLWVYGDGVYRSNGMEVAKAEIQALLGEERSEHAVQETLRWLEVATRAELGEPDLEVINVQNGRLRWRTGELAPHDPEIFEVVQLPVAYDREAACPEFDRYLVTTLDADVIPLVEEILGDCLIPDTRYEKAIMLTGEGANGKSVLLDTIKALLGAENVANVALHDLEENRFRVAELFGKLANIFADLDARALRSSAMFKTLVTGDTITAERKFGQPFTFANYARLLFSANQFPGSSDRTYAFYRRWLIVPFERTFTGDAADKQLREKLCGELSGILNRAVAGLQRLFTQGGFTEPPAVKAALADYQRDNDTVAAFAADYVREDPAGKVRKQYFYRVYRTWCKAQELRPVSQAEIKRRLSQRFPKLDEARVPRSTGPFHWIGIALTKDAPQVSEEDPDPKASST